MSRILQVFVSCFATATLVASAQAQQLLHPTKMQSPEQQKRDEAQCLTWAVQQSGYDPAKPGFAPQVSSPASAAGSSVHTPRRKGTTTSRPDAGDAAVAGAIVAASAQPAAGAAAAAIVGREAGNAVPGGAVAGATLQHDTARKPALQPEQSSSQQQTGYALFQKARIECVEARGYAVE